MMHPDNWPPYPLEEPVPGDWDHKNIDGVVCARPRGEQGMFLRVALLRSWTAQGLHQARAAQDLHAPPAPEKPSNPKDAAAFDRATFNVPVVAQIEEGLALFEGALKYGWNNYTVVGVRASVYVFATARHLLKFWCGQDRDPVSKVHHLGNAKACLSVLMDAQWRGKLEDDRPPALPRVDELFEHAACVMKGLLGLYGDRKPRHYTIGDTE